MADRTIMAALSQVVNRAALVGMLVQPETVLGWYRELVRRKWAAFGRRPAVDRRPPPASFRAAGSSWPASRLARPLFALSEP
jgi:hypothetical protein